MIFRGSGPPVPPSGSAHGMHLKEGTCLKCSFQRVVIIRRKVGLDFNSCYACLPLIRHVGRSSGSCRVETARCLHTNLLFWLGFLKYRNTMFGSVNQSSDEDPKLKLTVRISFCTAKSDIPQYKRFASFLPHAHIFKLTKRSILNTIRV